MHRSYPSLFYSYQDLNRMRLGIHQEVKTLLEPFEGECVCNEWLQIYGALVQQGDRILEVPVIPLGACQGDFLLDEKVYRQARFRVLEDTHYNCFTPFFQALQRLHQGSLDPYSFEREVNAQLACLFQDNLYCIPMAVIDGMGRTHRDCLLEAEISDIHDKALPARSHPDQPQDQQPDGARSKNGAGLTQTDAADFNGMERHRKRLYKRTFLVGNDFRELEDAVFICDEVWRKPSLPLAILEAHLDT